MFCTQVSENPCYPNAIIYSVYWSVHSLEWPAFVSQRYLPDSQMASAYAHAELFVFPSHFEGFGLPALEAMACDTPVVLAAATSLPEVGGEAAAYFEPGSPSDLARVMVEMLGDTSRRERLRALGLERAREFTWPMAASRTADVYRSAVLDS